MLTNLKNRLDSERVLQQHTMHQVIEKSNEFWLPLCIAYINYKKAFDSVEHEVIFQALRHIGINESYINIIEDIYTGAKDRVHIEKQESEEINILGQGDLISPKLSTAAIKEVFKNSEFESRGIDIELNVIALGFCCTTVSVIRSPWL